MISRRTVVCLGLSQLVSWGVSYYLIGGFGDDFVDAFGWSRERIYGGFALALLVMGLTSPLVGRWIDQHGGRRAMIAGSLCNAAGCAGLALCEGMAGYLLAWACLGLGMRLTLYDAAFAVLARIGGPQVRRSMAQITLLGGLASTVFWPVGHLLSELFGWRNALYCFAGLAVLTAPLHFAIPRERHTTAEATGRTPEVRRREAGRKESIVVGGLYAFIAAAVNFLNAGMSTHMIGILGGLGLAAGAAVGIAALRGVGQSSARLCEVLFGRNIDPLALNLLASALMPVCFLVGLYSGASQFAAATFSFLYGACNGILTITRGTLPLVLFDQRVYGERVGKLIAPSFVFSAMAPVVFAWVIERFGVASALAMSMGCAAMLMAAGAWLCLIQRNRRETAASDRAER